MNSPSRRSSQEPAPGRGLAAHCVRPRQRHGRGRADPASRSSRTGAPTSAARCSRRAARDKTKEVKTENGAGDAHPRASRWRGSAAHVTAAPYDKEGNRVGGPPVRALDRYEFAIQDGNLMLRKPYSVGEVVGAGANAEITGYKLPTPGQPVEGFESWPYPSSLPPDARPRKPKTKIADGGGRRSLLRSTGSRSARDSSAASSTSSFARFRATSAWFHTLGSATLTAFIVQALTGTILAMYYKPDPTRRTSRSSTSRTTSRWAGSCAGCTAGARACSSS